MRGRGEGSLLSISGARAGGVCFVEGKGDMLVIFLGVVDETVVPGEEG